MLRFAAYLQLLVCSGLHLCLLLFCCTRLWVCRVSCCRPSAVEVGGPPHFAPLPGCKSSARGGRPASLLFGLLLFLIPVLGRAGPAGTPRFGEARNPGPALDFRISTNPSGLRGKVPHALEFEPGVHCFSETHLSSVTLPQTVSQFRALGKHQGRNVRAVAGAAVPLRAHSAWAGGWSGVLTFADWPIHPIQVPWPTGIFETARIQLAQVLIEGFPLLVANIYGYSRGHPRATAATEALLEPITKEVVFGRAGPRMICGDLNADEDCLLQTSLWRQQGWIELQELMWQRWGISPCPTCKDSTRRDFLYLSPELAAACTNGAVTHTFQEHATLSANIRIASNAGAVRYWPRPAEIPWNSIALDGLQGQSHTVAPQILNTSVRFQRHAHLFEQSLNGHVDCPGRQLPSACFGRAKFVEPVVKDCSVQVMRKSRMGDESMQSDFLSLEVRRWFKQLRRLQSLKQALQRARHDLDALEYRGTLWRSIIRATGFHDGFRAWWHRRPVQHVGSPATLPLSVPDPATAACIFLDFRDHFRRFESWNISQRSKVLTARHDASKRRLFQDLQDPAGIPVDLLVNTKEYTILASDPQDRLLHVDKPLDFAGHSEWRVDGQVVSVEAVSADVCRIGGSFALPVDGELEQLQYVSSPSEIHKEFVQFWTQRWNKPCSAEQWDRILAFARAFLPRRPLHLPAISPAVWISALRNFRPRSARGPDSYARDDLLHMPTPRVAELLQLLTDVENGAEWPAQLLTGLVTAIHKPGRGASVKGYRPICVFSIIYRCWASLRARQVLQWLRDFIPVGSLGFMPGHETAEAWYAIEGLVECAVQDSRDLSGYGTDLVQAFNNLPRLPLFKAAALLGLPDTLLTPWQAFVHGTQRRFVVQGAVSEPVSSTCGFAEGCPLSTVAMSICSFLYHEYMRAFAPSVESLSYVDNLLGVGRGAYDVAVGLNTTRCLCEALALELDGSKTYAWSTSSSQRRILRAMDLQVLDLSGTRWDYFFQLCHPQPPFGGALSATCPYFCSSAQV